MRLGGKGKDGAKQTAGDGESEDTQGAIGTLQAEYDRKRHEEFVAAERRKREAAARKALPVWSGVMMYFPLVWAEIAKVSKLGNDQHNPGQPLHWSRTKSDDHLDSAMRHLLDYGQGKQLDTDGAYHLAKAIWRVCAQLELDLEIQQPFEVSSIESIHVDPAFDRSGLR